MLAAASTRFNIHIVTGMQICRTTQSKSNYENTARNLFQLILNIVYINLQCR